MKKEKKKMKSYLIYCLLFLLSSKSKQTKITYDCRSLNELNMKSNNSLLVKPSFNSCGLIPGQFLSNNHTNVLFYLNWKFNTEIVNSLKIKFQLDYAENVSQLRYQYSYRKFTSLNEKSTQALQLSEKTEIKTKINSHRINKLAKTSQNETENILILEYDPVPESFHSQYDILDYMYVICVLIVNLKEGFVFTLPFMCIDVIVDPAYYDSLNNHSSSISEYGILITLGPFVIFLLIFIGIIDWKFHKTELESIKSSSTLAHLVKLNKSNLLAANLLKKIGNEEEPLNGKANRNSTEHQKKYSYVSNSRRFSRYELYEDCPPLATNDELLIFELDTCIRKQTIPNEVTNTYLLKDPSCLKKRSDRLMGLYNSRFYGKSRS